MRRWRLGGSVLLMASLLILAGCATAKPKFGALEQMQYDYSAAIRWGDFEGAWQVVDPEYRKQHPLTDIEFERYKQIQISGYQDLASSVNPDGTAMREVEIGIINKNTMTERSIRYTELWRYDPTTKRWWIVGGLPDFWRGE